MINSATIVGRLTADVQLKKSTSNKSVVQFTVAVPRFGQDAGSDFITCVAWSGLAETISKYCHKGDQVCINGRISTRNYEDKDGKKVYVTEIVVTDFDFGAKKNGQAQASNNSDNDSWLDITSEDLPF